jgi:hypothetical protein
MALVARHFCRDSGVSLARSMLDASSLTATTFSATASRRSACEKLMQDPQLDVRVSFGENTTILPTLILKE